MEKHRSNCTAGFKLPAIIFAEEHGNRGAARKFKVHEKMAKNWCKQRHELENTSYLRCCFTNPKSGKFSQIESEVVCSRAHSHNVFRGTHSKQVVGGLPNSCIKTICRFDGEQHCQKLLAYYGEKVINFQQFVLRAQQNTAYLLSQIGNADQIPVYFDMTCKNTITEKGMQSCENLRCTVMLAITIDGRKLPPYVIFKRKKGV
ncbi:hypothetical protein PR048_006277 [Dryococelus australis]|uniref:Uncharacterized protein n=1 Tax=Dryococelus australis TaxID=614101 RepID=A0ABQ9IB43_9NEOP|nr:hypothetical protein PR048_006277 [Dryococelus australis]